MLWLGLQRVEPNPLFLQLAEPQIAGGFHGLSPQLNRGDIVFPCK